MSDETNTQETQETSEKKQTRFKLNPAKALTAGGVSILFSVAMYGIIAHYHAKHSFSQMPITTPQQNAEITKRMKQLSEQQANARPPSDGPNAKAPDSPLPDGSITDDPFSTGQKNESGVTHPEAQNPNQQQEKTTSQPQENAAIPAPAPETSTTQTQAPSSATPSADKPQAPSQTQPPTQTQQTEKTAETKNNDENPITGKDSLQALASLPNSYEQPESLASKLPAFGESQESDAKNTNPKEIASSQSQTLTDEEQALQTEIQADQEKLKEIQAQIAASKSGHIIPSLPSDPSTPAPSPSDIPTNVIEDTTLVAGTQNAVIISRKGKISTWKMNSIIPEIGHAKALIPWNGTWQLVTDSGLIRPSENEKK